MNSCRSRKVSLVQLNSRLEIMVQLNLTPNKMHEVLETIANTQNEREQLWATALLALDDIDVFNSQLKSQRPG